MESPATSVDTSAQPTMPVRDRRHNVEVYYFQSAVMPLPVVTQRFRLNITRYTPPQELSQVFSALERHAVREYREGRTRSLREFASDEGISLNE